MSSNRFSFPVLLAALFLVAGVLLVGCSSGDQTLSGLEPDVVPAFPDYNQVSAILERSCVPCHTGSAGEDKPASVSSEDDDDKPPLDSCEAVQRHLSRVVESIHEKTMPPGAWPRLEEDEKLLIDRWFLNGACSPCTEPCPETES